MAIDVFSETVDDDVSPEEEERGVKGGEKGRCCRRAGGDEMVAVDYLGEASYVN